MIYGLAGVLTLIPLPEKRVFRHLSLLPPPFLSLLILPTFTLNTLRAFRNLSAPERQTVFAQEPPSGALSFLSLAPMQKEIMGAGFLTLTRALSDTLIALMLSGNVFLTPKTLSAPEEPSPPIPL